MLQRNPGGSPGETRIQRPHDDFAVHASTKPRRVAGGDVFGPVLIIAGVVGASTKPRRVAGGDRSMCSRSSMGTVVLQRNPGGSPGETGPVPAQASPRHSASTKPRRVAGGDAAHSRAIHSLIPELQRNPGGSPGETSSRPRCTDARSHCFNETPAGRRGRRRREDPRPDAADASTKPRRVAGGDVAAGRVLDVGGVVASTKPRRVAGGDQARTGGEGGGGCIGASTKPRRVAGGDVRGPEIRLSGVPASTKPRRVAGGDRMYPLQRNPGGSPGETGGPRRVRWPVVGASTKPRRVAGGDRIVPTH